MEFDSKLAIIQAVLRNQDKIHGCLENIVSGDESKVNAVKKKLSQAVEEECMSKHDLRRIYLLFLLNTDHDCRESLYEDPNYVHVMGSIPKLSKYLFIEIVNHLKLDEFLYESIIFLPPVLSIEVVEIYFTLLKRKDPFQLLNYVDFISRSIIVKLILLENNCDEDIFNVKLKYFEFLLLALENFSTSKMDEYKSWEQNKLYYFTACIMKALTSIVKTCCKYYIQPLICRETCHDIYEIIIKKKFIKEVKVQLDVKEKNLLQNCVQIVLSKFLSSAQSVTILTWMSWLELEEYTEENLQSAIGNEVYYCLNYIKNKKIESCVNSNLHSELITVLTNLSIKPMNEDDEIELADIQTVLSSINDPTKSQSKWLSALISHKDFKPDITSLTIIHEKVDLLNQKDSEVLLDKCIEFLKKSSNTECSNDEPNENVKNLFKMCVLNSLKNFHADNQIVILESFITKYGVNNLLKLPDFESQMTEIFNKVIDKDSQTIDVLLQFYSDFIGISFQSPEAVIRKILKEALSSTQHGKLMVDLLKILKPISSYKPNNTNDSVLHSMMNDMTTKIETLSDNEKDCFVALITRLIKKSLVDGNEFLICSLMPQLYDSIQTHKWPLVILLLDVLKSYTDGSLINEQELDSKLPILIVFLGQLIDKTRCTLSYYNAQSIAVCDKALEVLISVMESFDVDTQKISAMNWLNQELRKLSILTQLHVLSYINVPSMTEHISKTSIEVYWLKVIVCGIETDISFLYDMRRDSFLRTLAKVLPRFTTREWKIMFTNLVPKEEAESLHTLFIAAADTVLLLEAILVPHIKESKVIDISESDDVIPNKASTVVLSSATSCLCFIIKNLITIVQDVIFPHVKKLTREQLAELFIKICKVLHAFPQAAQNYTSWILLKVLQDIISSAQLPKINKGDKSTEINKFCAGIGLIPNIELRQNLSKTVMTTIKSTETAV